MNNWLFELQIYHSAEKKKQGSSLVLPEEVLICTSKDKPCWHYITESAEQWVDLFPNW